VPNARKIGRIIGSDSTSHFETPQSHGNDSETRELGSVRVEDENFGECSDMPPRSCSAFGETSSVWYYELLKSSETITGDRYRMQLMGLSRALKEKRPQYQERHDKVILQHDNARPHIARPVKTYLETLKWEVLPHRRTLQTLLLPTTICFDR